jgi:hypothetical protein
MVKYRYMQTSQKGGFIQLIILIVIALLIMKYSGLTISGVWHWFTSFFSVVLQ